MVARRRKEIADALRQRIDRGLITRALASGDRLPSTREIASELNTNRRVVAAAYTQLASEGLVEIRERSGAYVLARNFILDAVQTPSASVIAGILAEGVIRGHSLRDFSDHIRDAAAGRKLKAVVIAATEDQTKGIARELLEDYGLDASGLIAESLKLTSPLPRSIREAHMIITTERYGPAVQRLADKLGKPSIVMTVRPGIVSEEWLGLMKKELFVIAVDPRFLKMLREYLAGTPGMENVTMLVAGESDVSLIPHSAPTYVTQAARAVLGRTRIPGRLIPPPRIFAPDCVRAIVDLIISLNAENIQA